MSTCRLYWFTFAHAENSLVQMRGASVLDVLEEKYAVTGRLIVPPKSGVEKVQFLSLILKLLVDRRKCTKVMIQQVVEKSFYSKCLLFLAKMRNDIVYDIDCTLGKADQIETCIAFLQEAKMVLSGSCWLQRFVQKKGRMSFYLPTPSSSFISNESPLNQKLTIGWIADYRLDDFALGTQLNLQVLETVVIPAAKKVEIPLKLELIGLTSPRDRNAVRRALSGFPLIELCMTSEFTSTTCQEAIRYVEEWDLAFNPCVENEFNRTSESAWNQLFLSAGVPVMTNTHNEYGKLIEHGVNGWRCSTNEAFSNCIRSYVGLGQEAKNRIRKQAIQSVKCRSLESTTERIVALMLSDVISNQSASIPQNS